MAPGSCLGGCGMAQILCSASFYLVARCPLLSALVTQLVWGLWSVVWFGFKSWCGQAFKGWYTVVAMVIHPSVYSVCLPFCLFSAHISEVLGYFHWGSSQKGNENYLDPIIGSTNCYCSQGVLRLSLQSSAIQRLVNEQWKLSSAPRYIRGVTCVFLLPSTISRLK